MWLYDILYVQFFIFSNRMRFSINSYESIEIKIVNTVEII